MRVIDESVKEEARNRPYCEWCGKPNDGRLDCSHSIGVGAGGDDTRLNTTGICRKCHSLHHDGHEPTTYQLLQLAKYRELTRKPDGTHARVIGKNLGIPRKEL